MDISKILLAGVVALTLIACGKKEEGAAGASTETSREAVKADAASPLEADYRLKGGEPIDIDALFALIPDASRPTYESAEFDKKLGATVVTNLRFADADDGEGLLVKRAEFYGVDLDAIDRIKNAEAPAPDAPFETVFQKVRFFDVASEGFKEKDENAKIAIGGVEFDNLAIRQGGVEGDGKGNEAARFFNAINLAGLYFKDISVSASGKDAPSIAFAAPDLRFVGLSGGKLDAVVANDLDYDLKQSDESLAAMRAAMGPEGAMLMSGPIGGFIAPKAQHTKLKSFEWRGVDLSGLLAWGLKDEKPPMTERDLIDLGTMKAADIESFINDKKVASVKEATLSAANFTWLAPSKIRADTKGAVYDLTAYVPETEKESLKILKDNGLDKIKGDGYAEWTWNADNGAAGLDYVANADGLADFALAFDFSGLKLKDLAKAAEDGEAKPIAKLGKFDSLSLTLKDEKALDTLFALSALQMGGTGDDLRQSAPAMIRLSGAQVAQMSPRMSDYVNAVADFVAKGGTLKIAAKPAKPVAFSALQGASDAPQTLPDVIDLKVTREE